MKKVFVPSIVFLFFIGCMPDETPCTYNRQYISILTSGEWNVDSLHTFIYDTLSLYSRDTTYVNDGSIKFLSDKLNCDNSPPMPGGKIVFTRPDGQVYEMKYSFRGFGPPIYSPVLIKIYSVTSLDGYSSPYDITLWINVENAKITISEGSPYGTYYSYSYFNPGIKQTRFWEFTLSKK